MEVPTAGIRKYDPDRMLPKDVLQMGGLLMTWINSILFSIFPMEAEHGPTAAPVSWKKHGAIDSGYAPMHFQI